MQHFDTKINQLLAVRDFTEELCIQYIRTNVQIGGTRDKTDWIFVQQAKKGDSHAFARLYEIYYKDLYHFALYYTKDSITAEDAVSSAVLKAFEQLHKLRKNDAFKSWLFQITANECKKNY